MTNCAKPSHGRYSHGCRCEGCRRAHATYTRERRAASLDAGTLRHGLASTYDAGCRCLPCREARLIKYDTGRSEYKAKRRQREPFGGAA